uniref:hypothetical protein n=1 Tax=Nocardioides sp. GY 10113 TaxID=2569761 RepID=UPI0010A8DBA9|nr:hypothetical protein [Nocardioides sp. GY 10113]TIC87951.1 hypothetical protein E8D34_06565 [Nocardioides sp. GY 10113]
MGTTREQTGRGARPRPRRRSRLTWTAPALAAVTALAVATPVTGPVPPAGSSAGAATRVSGSLDLSLERYYGGQALGFVGDLGVAGTTRIWLEHHMGRVGDRWTRIGGSEGTTQADGTFDLTFPARAMKGISVRVASQQAVTTPVLLHADEQAAWVSVTTDEELDTTGYVRHVSYPARAGQPMTVRVDTSPRGEPVLRGRRVTLQRRAANGDWRTTWTSVATARVRPGGRAFFHLDAPDDRAQVTYRARLEDWTRAGSEIGWFPSYPVEIDLLPADSARATVLRAASVERSRTAATVGGAARATTVGPTASATNRWGRSLFDFNYEYGESLTHPPIGGSRRQGSWVEYSTGAGRVAGHNGGLMLTSKFTDWPRRSNAGPGDHGTTAATLLGNARTYGRWELRLRPWNADDAEPGRDYRVRAELVPADSAERACGARSIVIADLTPNEPEVRFGAYTPDGDRSWTGAADGMPVERVARAYAVEVTRRHLSWLVDGRVVGTVRAREAVPGVPLTLRLSLVGAGDAEMQHTYAHVDWVRGFTLRHGSRVRDGARLERGTNPYAC